MRSPQRSCRMATHCSSRTGIHEVVQAPQADLVAAIAAAHALTQAGHPVGGLVPERRLAVLHVVVERAVHEGDLTQGQRDQRQPVVVVVGKLGGGKGSAVVEQIAPHTSVADPTPSWRPAARAVGVVLRRRLQ